MGIAERKERERNQRRDDIVLAAEKLFNTKGFGKATMDDVAAEAELSKGTLYLYFRNKSELHYAVILAATSRLNDRLSDLSGSPGTGLEKLKLLGQRFLSLIRECPAEIKAITELEGLSPEELDLSREELRETVYTRTPVRLVLEFIQQAIEENSIRKDIPAMVIAHTLWLQFLSIVQISMTKKGLFEVLEFSTEELYESLIEIVLNGIRS
ncbi:MAG: TetR/AcrR family transcriptional regulator [Bacteroidales bacterium]|nr:TetR/AcrR family transcriptional regulator [Bacteroidales bacterium]